MFSDVKIIEALSLERKKFHEEGDMVVREFNKILSNEQFNEKNILKNLKSYNQNFDLLDEDLLDKSRIYGIKEIKNICIQYNLRFLDSQLYKGEFPSEAIYTIQELNKEQRREFRNFKVLGPVEIFRQKGIETDPMLFAETRYGNFYLIHQWDNKVKWYASLLQFPMRKFENLIGTLIVFSALIALLTPNKLLVSDGDFGYWDTHRMAFFFYAIIFNSAFTVFFLFAFHRSFSSSSWDENKN